MARFRMYSKNGSSWLFRSEYGDAQAAAAAGHPHDAVGYCITPDGYTPTTMNTAPADDGGIYFLWFRFGRGMAWTKFSNSTYTSIAAALVDALADTKTGGSVDYIVHPSTRTPDADLAPMYRLFQ